MLVETAPPATAKPQVSELGRTLLTAAAVIEEYGWVQDEMGSKGRGFCAVGAIYQTIGDLQQQIHFGREHRLLLHSLMRFNDRYATTSEEVIDRLKTTAYAV